MVEFNNDKVILHHTIEDVMQMDFRNKNVLIIGCPASGKTWLADKMWEKRAWDAIIYSDNYMVHGYKEALYVMMKDIEKHNSTLIEGVQGYRLLRKGVELNTYYPDIVIELVITQQQMEVVYKKERDEKKIKYLKQFNAMHDKIITDYFAMPNDRKPIWIKVQNHEAGSKG